MTQSHESEGTGGCPMGYGTGQGRWRGQQTTMRQSPKAGTTRSSTSLVP